MIFLLLEDLNGMKQTSIEAHLFILYLSSQDATRAIGLRDKNVADVLIARKRNVAVTCQAVVAYSKPSNKAHEVLL